MDECFKGALATHWKLNVWRQRPSGSVVVSGWRHDAWDRSYYRSNPKLDDGLQGDLAEWFGATFPRTHPLQVRRRWSGVFGWTADYLPMVGPLPGRTGELVISGFSGGGLPFAFRAGEVIARAVSGHDPLEGTQLLNPRRFT